MNLLIQLFAIILWSSLSEAERLIPQSSVAIPSAAFKYTPNLSVTDEANSFEIQNMPAIHSQDTVGSCFGCGSATIVQKFLCDNEASYQGTPCNQLPQDKLISQLSMVSWADTNEFKYKTEAENKVHNKQVPGERANHSNVKLYNQVSIFSSGSNALLNSMDSFKFMPESCYPFDQLVSKYGNRDSKLFEEIYMKTQALYEKKKRNKLEKTEGKTTSCDECLSQLSKDFNTNFSAEGVQSALQKSTFGEFLYELLFHNCKPIEPLSRPNFMSLPGKNQKVDKEQAKKALKEVLRQGYPALITDLCLEVNSQSNKCTSSHTTVLSGYRRVCPTTNLKDENCKIQLKFHNCWGADWQKSNNGGWVDEDSVFKYINYGNTTIDEDQISWLEKNL